MMYRLMMFKGRNFRIFRMGGFSFSISLYISACDFILRFGFTD